MTALLFQEHLSLRVPPRDLWRFLYDTDRLNRLVKLPAVKFRPDPDKRRKGHYLAEIGLGPLRYQYDEHPFEWVEERYYRVLRRFHSGPFLSISGGIRMAPENGGTALEIYAEVEPRGIVGRHLAQTFLKKSAIGAVVQQVRAFEAGYSKSEKPVYAIARRQVSESKLAARLENLRSAEPEAGLITLFEELIRNGSDIEVTRMRPFEMADRWGKDRFDVLKMMLHATKAGLVDLNWEILCPHCRAPSAGGQSLGELKSQSVCDTCEVTFRVDLANSVEAVFSVNPAVREARRDVYCIGGPANTPRIIAQLRLEPTEKRSEKISTVPGPLTVRSYQSSGLVPVEVMESGAADISVTCGKTLTVSASRMAGAANVAVTNQLPEECLLVIERDVWRNAAATAAIVMTIQEFRDLFPEEAVSPGQEIGMGRLAVLFTDLSGSTELYEKLGDVKAFDFVQSHFQYLIGLVSRHHGGVIKTMGDAIMAVFNNGVDALASAAAMQEDWERFVSKYKFPSAIRLRIGVHEGPAVAFNNKGLQDYFGTTVNMAARIQAQADGSEIVISKAMNEDSDVKSYVESTFGTRESFVARLKGISEEQTLFRLRR